MVVCNKYLYYWRFPISNDNLEVMKGYLNVTVDVV